MLNSFRIETKWTRVIDGITPRGTTTDFTADASVHTTTSVPATTATTCATITRLLCHTPSR
jgi:hypothetical protein